MLDIDDIAGTIGWSNVGRAASTKQFCKEIYLENILAVV
jgi:hypothetical protein